MISETIILDNRDQEILQEQMVSALNKSGHPSYVDYIGSEEINIIIEGEDGKTLVKAERNPYKPGIVILSVQNIRMKYSNSGLKKMFPSVGDNNTILKIYINVTLAILLFSFLYISLQILLQTTSFIIYAGLLFIAFIMYKLNKLRKSIRKSKDEERKSFDKGEYHQNIIKVLKTSLTSGEISKQLEHNKKASVCWNCFHKKSSVEKYCANCGKK